MLRVVYLLIHQKKTAVCVCVVCVCVCAPSPCRTSSADWVAHTCRCCCSSPPYRRSTEGSSRDVEVRPCLSLEAGARRLAAHLQVRDVAVDVHGGGDAVLGDVLVVVGVRLAVDGVDAGKRNPLLAQSHVAVSGESARWLGSVHTWTCTPPPPQSIIPTSAGLSPPRETAWRPSLGRWPAAPPTPWSCGCSSPEASRPRGSLGTRRLPESGKAWGGGGGRPTCLSTTTMEIHQHYNVAPDVTRRGRNCPQNFL